MISCVRAAEWVKAVEEAFEVTGRAHVQWPDPHTDRGPADDEYSRVTNGEKWRIISARADAWLSVLGDAGVATIERDVSVVWRSEPRTRITRSDRAVPRRAGALPLVIARSTVGDVPDAGVTLGVGDPAECVAWIPNCGCDACDSGSQNELSELDQVVIGVVLGTFRRLTAGRRQITQLHAGGWSASGSFRQREVDAILADPRGWHELSGVSWTDLG